MRKNLDPYFEAFDLSSTDRQYYELGHYRYIEIPASHILEHIAPSVEPQDASQSTQPPPEDSAIYLSIKPLVDALTPIQQQVLALWMDGRTQQEIANEVGKHQTTIQKCLFGNWDPVYGKYHGGVFHRLKTLYDIERSGRKCKVDGCFKYTLVKNAKAGTYYDACGKHRRINSAP